MMYDTVFFPLTIRPKVACPRSGLARNTNEELNAENWPL
jgi:hypothetical protein